MASSKTPYAGNPAVVDIEAGPVDAGSIKAAALVAEQFYDNRELARIDSDLADFVLDATTSKTRAARDRDRAFPRDVSEVNERKRRHLPDPGTIRADLSSRQRKDRSTAKRRCLQSASATQVTALQGLVGNPDRWTSLNSSLTAATGNAQHLTENDRVAVQRIDRLIQSYERDTDRGHVVYVVAQLPGSTPVAAPSDVPVTLQRGARISFDQFTVAAHTLHEAQAAVDARAAAGDTGSTVILEIETSRGMYLGRSDSLDDTSHLLPRGMPLLVRGIDADADYLTPTGHGSTMVVQLTDSTRPEDYVPPVAARRRIQAAHAKQAAAQKKDPTP